MGVTDQPREQPRQPEEGTTIETRTRRCTRVEPESPMYPLILSRWKWSRRTWKRAEAVNTIRGGPPLTQEAAKGAKDCGHFLCQRVGGVCLQGGGEQQRGGGNLRPGFQASNTGYQASNTGYQATNTDYQKLPCSPQVQTVVWRSIPISRTSNNNNGKRAGLTLDLGNAFLQGEAALV